MSLQDELNMAVIFITHNFGVVAEIADRVSVMYLGNAVETAAVDDIFYNPKHPYTRALLQSIPRLDGQKRRRLQTIEGMVPDPFNLPTGCVFHTRCAEKMAGKCTSQIPELTYFENDQMARCHLHQA
ncbi:oligopeptide/dipeptide ABC transporter ATP-binding protein [Pseudovibrio sp. POLY-S9]